VTILARVSALVMLPAIALGLLPAPAASGAEDADRALLARGEVTTDQEAPWVHVTDRLVVLAERADGAETRGGEGSPRRSNEGQPRSQEGRERAEQARARVAELSGRAARLAGDLGDGRQMIELDAEIANEEADEIVEHLVAEGLVAEAEVDRRVTLASAPNDPHYRAQWNLHNRYGGSLAYGIDVEPAWDLTTGSDGVVVAVLDSGVIEHPDIADRLVAGYDFVDGDADATDPGDWCEQTGSSSSWHGTHVAGIIGASTDNGVGVAGVDQQARIQPVRVVGSCGGSQTDILRGIRWAAGVKTPTAPTNATPADVINLSLGARDRCSNSMQSAIDDAVEAGALVVAAAGNRDEDARDFSPANCDGVVTVAATTRVGDRAFYSNYGEVVDLAAPGGDVSYGNPDAAVLSLSNRGTTAPDPDGMTYAYQQGTSMAAPHVAGIASLIRSVDPDLSPDELRKVLRKTATAFPGSSPFGAEYVCSSDPRHPRHCGAGIANAGAAVAEVTGKQPDVDATPPPDEDEAPEPGEGEDDRGAPPAPTLEAALVDDGAELSWTEVQHPDGIDAYELYQSTSSNCSRSEDERYHGSATSYTATGLDGGTTYRFCVVAIADSGEVSALSNVVEVTPSPPPSPPSFGSTATLAFDLTEDDRVRLAWPAASGTVDEYEVLRDGEVVAATTSRGATMRDLEVGERYHLEVRARNRGGDSEPIGRWVAPVGDFADVPAGSTFERDIRWMATAEITRGCADGRFCPADGVTRQQMAAFVVRALGLTETSSLTFSDVPSTSPFAQDINRLATAGVTLGCDSERFCPTQTVTRQQMAAFIVRALGLTETSGLRFDDVPAGSTFEDHIDRLATAEVTLGCGGNDFCPTHTVTRQQMAAFLRRALTG
jgi:serine protease